MIIEGTVVSSGRETRMRADAAALRAMRHKELANVDRERQHMYATQRLHGAADVAERQLAEIVTRQHRRAVDIATMRAESAETGRLNPYLAVAVLELAEYPPMIAAARARLDVAREALAAAEMTRQSDLAAEQAETVESEQGDEPVAQPARGRGRPPKTGAA